MAPAGGAESLAEEAERELRARVRLGEDAHRGLLDDLLAAERAGLCGEV